MTYTVPYYDNSGHSTEGADTTAWGFYRASSAGVPAFVTPIGDARDATGSRPASTTTAGWAITSNYDGRGAVEFWSTVNAAASQGFSFHQKTGAATDLEIGRLYGDSTFTEWDFFVNSSGTIGGYFYADATGFYVGENSGCPDFYLQASVNGTIQFQVNGTTRAGVATTGFYTVPVAVATLPAAGSAGRIACVSNALAPVVGAAVVGGGAAKALVWDNGAAWNVLAV